MDEMIKKISGLLVEFNKTFKLEANIIDENGEKIAVGLKIKETKNDGSEFVDEMFDMFCQIINSTNEYELVFDEQKGLGIAKKVVKVEYILNE